MWFLVALLSLASGTVALGEEFGWMHLLSVAGCRRWLVSFPPNENSTQTKIIKQVKCPPPPRKKKKKTHKSNGKMKQSVVLFTFWDSGWGSSSLLDVTG